MSNNLVMFRTVAVEWVREVQYLGRRDDLHQWSYHGSECVGYRIDGSDTYALYLLSDRADGGGTFVPDDKYGGVQVALSNPRKRTAAEREHTTAAAEHWREYDRLNPGNPWAIRAPENQPKQAGRKRSFLDFLRGRK